MNDRARTARGGASNVGRIAPIDTIGRGTHLGPYEIIDSLGAGGMGEVFRARDTRLDRSVAVKVLPREFAKDSKRKLRFEREARTISQLNHPNICTLYDVGHDSGTDYLVMELCDGQTLGDRLQRGPLPLEQALTIAVQVADALDRAHREGIIHRDLKPGNIMITKSGAKLLDFGLAKSLEPFEPLQGSRVQTERQPLTEEGTIVGSMQYMAPEQLEGAEADARGDIFAFGAVLYEMISGRRAFDGKTRASVIASILEREPVPLSQLQPLTPPALERVVRACMEKSPDERWQSAHDLRRELQWLLEARSRPSEAVAPRSRRLRRLMLAGLVVLPLLAASATLLWTRSTATPPRRVVSALAPPRGTQFVVTGDAAGPVTLSPDGRLAAFVTTGGGAPDLWVQSLDTGTATRLPGTSRAMFPFWSPDGRSIGYFASGKLMVIDLDGSAARALADAPDARGGAWTPDGWIVYTPQTQTGLFRIPAAGGRPTQITLPKQPYSTHRWPALLPDGRHLVYLAAMHGDPAGLDTAIFISALDGKESRHLVASGSNGIPYRDVLLFLRRNRLVAQRIENGALTGPAVALFDGVLSDPGTWRAIFSVSNDGVLALHRQGRASLALKLVSLDSRGKEIGEAAPPAIYRDVALSPDGKKVALTIGDPNSMLYVEDLVRHVRSRLSFFDAVGMPVWTPDGRSLVFNRLLAKDAYAILIKPADGSAVERELTTAPYPLQPTCVDMVQGVVLYNPVSSNDNDLMGVPLAGGKPFTVVGGPGQQVNGVVSPGGRWLAYVEINRTGRAAYVTTYPAAGPKWQVSDDTAYWLWWNDKGDEIRYLTGDSEVKRVRVTFQDKSVQFGAPEGMMRVHVNTNRRPLSMTPDGSRILAAVISNEDPGPATLVTNFDQKLP